MTKVEVGAWQNEARKRVRGRRSEDQGRTVSKRRNPVESKGWRNPRQNQGDTGPRWSWRDEGARWNLSDGQGRAKRLTGRGEEMDLEACGAARGSPQRAELVMEKPEAEPESRRKPVTRVETRS